MNGGLFKHDKALIKNVKNSSRKATTRYNNDTINNSVITVNSNQCQ